MRVQMGREGGQWESVLSLPDARFAVAEGGGLLAAALRCLAGVPNGDDARALVEPSEQSIARLEPLLKGMVETGRDRRLISELSAQRDVILVGPSASGKTLSAQLVTSRELRQGSSIVWLDLTLSGVNATSLVAGLAAVPAGEARPLVIVDNFQANPLVGSEICKLVESFREQSRSQLSILLITWPSARQLTESVLPVATVLQAIGEEVVSVLGNRRGLKDETLDKLAELSKGDLVVANLAISFATERGTMPDLDEAAELYVNERPAVIGLPPETRKLLYWFAALGSFEIRVQERYADSLPPAALNELVDTGLVRIDNATLTVGHRSQAALIAKYASRRWAAEVAQTGSVTQIAVDYLRGSDDLQIRATLDQLDLVSIAFSGAEDAGAFLARAWRSLNLLGGYLARQVKSDPTWADNLSSAVFACDALAAIGKTEEWSLSADYVRSRWLYDNDFDLPRPNGDLPAEWYDFPEIRKRMLEEDSRQGGAPPARMGYADIDFTRFHRTWALGLLLGFEGAAVSPDRARLNRLKAIAQEQQEPDGSFYPARVPWLTARVVLGMVRAGENYSSSRVVKDACDWLRTAPPGGPYSLGAWDSGTGTWNTRLMTTAMCLAALGSASVPIHDNAMRVGRIYMRSQRHECGVPGSEIDTSLFVEAMLLVGGLWRDLAPEISQLLAWAEDRNSWLEAGQLASDSQTESGKIPFVVGSLISILWSTVKQELPLLLESVGGPWSALQAPAESVRERQDEPQISRIVATLNELRGIAEKNVSDRQLALTNNSDSPIISRNLAEWRRKLNEVHELLAEITGKEINENQLSQLAERVVQLRRGMLGS
ncbi:hypothetical protein SAMN05421541_107170 [Actinoplanes philippinensis]|uniref:Uncharacterized protein n=1 Tax=Actinoplanes philippinensis TaxID=35752 RepID=A0A1I2GW52_9ACTN|nr:hypothetical protein [Actinoplanes philippinensis]SFF20811.1 hypothetical protein SAMN05421541_107170 [Actinoplanes philippinensis]